LTIKGHFYRELAILAGQVFDNRNATIPGKEKPQNYRNGDPTEMTTIQNPPLRAGQVWDAGLNMEGPLNQRGRWGVKREAHKLIVFYHYFFPKLDVTSKAFEVGEDNAAQEYARQCCETKTIPGRK
jgi:hypothetical protein